MPSLPREHFAQDQTIWLLPLALSSASPRAASPPLDEIYSFVMDVNSASLRWAPGTAAGSCRLVSWLAALCAGKVPGRVISVAFGLQPCHQPRRLHLRPPLHVPQPAPHGQARCALCCRSVVDELKAAVVKYAQERPHDFTGKVGGLV